MRSTQCVLTVTMADPSYSPAKPSDVPFLHSTEFVLDALKLWLIDSWLRGG
jgi:hypothetical protein